MGDKLSAHLLNGELLFEVFITSMKCYSLILLLKFPPMQVFQCCATVPESGCFYPPTLVTNVQPVSRIVQEEVSKPLFCNQDIEFHTFEVPV